MPDAAGSARELHAHAKDLLNTGDVPAAEDLLRRARQVAGTTEELALVDGTLAVVEAELGDVDTAITRCRHALDGELDDRARALLDGQLGYVTLLAGEVSDAVDLFTRALECLDGNERATVLLNRATAHLIAGKLDEASVDLTRGQEVDDPIAAAQCRHNMGYLHLLRGELVEALRQMDTARRDLIRLGPATVATCDIDRSEALAAVGLVREAIGVLRRTHAAVGATDLWRYRADVELRLAGLVGGRDGTHLAQQAASRFAAHGNPGEADRARAVLLRLRADSATPPPADDLEVLANDLTDTGRVEATELLIRAAGLRGETPAPVDRDAPLSTRLLAGEVAAAVALAAGDSDDALRRASRAIGELEEWQRSIGSLELQSSTLGLGAAVIRVGQRAALASGDPGALLEWSERAREVASRGVPTRPPDELGDLLAQLRHLGPEGDADERARLIEQIRHGRWHAEGSVEPAAALTLDQLRGAIGDARFVSLLCIDGQVIALAVSADDVEVHRLGPWADLESRLGGLGADLAVAAQSPMPLVRRSLAERLAAIDAILAPAFSGAADVVLTVPDELARVPWGQLASLRDVAITLPVSATAWVHAGQQPAAPPRSVAVVVGPDTRTGKGEADAVAHAWGDRTVATVLTDATSDQVRELAAEVDVLHVCAHGHDRDGHRLFAATELHDGPWFGHDVELLPRVPDVVVLSACGVGGGSLGMARAWLHAGARHVIAAPADIAEAAAAERFPRLHALLADGVAPERAVAEAFGPDALDCAVQCYGPPPLSER